MRMRLIVIVLVAMLVSACSFMPRTATPTAKPSETPTPSPIVETQAVEPTATETLQPTSTAEPTPVVEYVYMEGEQITAGRFQLDLEIVSNKQETDAFLEKYGIGRFALNENNADVREDMGRLFAQSLLNAYNYQNEENISLDQYLIDPSRYPAGVMVRGEDGRLEERSVTLDQVETFKIVITEPGADLYLGLHGSRYGYGFDDGEFTIFLSLTVEEGIYGVIQDFGLDEENDLPLMMGQPFEGAVIAGLVMAMHGPEMMIDYRVPTGNDVVFTKRIRDAADLPDLLGVTLSESLSLLHDRALWLVNP